MTQTTKRQWQAPVLTAYGDVQSITLQIDKDFGFNDGLNVAGDPIGCSS